jgi:hypothetical protein
VFAVIGDKYHVFSSSGGGTIPHGVFDTWAEAKAARNEIFYSQTNTRAAWIMRRNPSLDLRPELYGFTLRRTKHEVA